MASDPKPKSKKSYLRRLLIWPIRLLLGFYGLCLIGLLYLSIGPPLITTVQIQRWIESWGADTPYSRHYEWQPADQIDDDLEHALVAAEDGRFYEHHGVDWEAIEDALEESKRGKRRRGGSTITQQLVKNLFLTTHSTYIRKGLELPLAYMADFILSKDRILELYLNVIEWGPGVYGAEAATQYHYRRPAARLSRAQAARLAAIVPSPRRRRPQAMNRYSRIILRRMQQMGY